MSAAKVKAAVRPVEDPERELYKVTLVVSLPVGTSVDQAWEVVAFGAVAAAEGPVEVVSGYGAAVRLLGDGMKGARGRGRCTGFANKAIPKKTETLLMFCHNDAVAPNASQTEEK